MCGLIRTNKMYLRHEFQSYSSQTKNGVGVDVGDVPREHKNFHCKHT
jgi:hypothetical protein